MVFILESEVFFVYSAIVFKAFQRGPTQYFLQKKTLNKEVKENNNNKKPNPILDFYIQTWGAQTTI
jgi:hypothetical protein